MWNSPGYTGSIKHGISSISRSVLLSGCSPLLVLPTLFHEDESALLAAATPARTITSRSALNRLWEAFRITGGKEESWERMLHSGPIGDRENLVHIIVGTAKEDQMSC